jgi:hypothetical protein
LETHWTNDLANACPEGAKPNVQAQSISHEIEKETQDESIKIPRIGCRIDFTDDIEPDHCE